MSAGQCSRHAICILVSANGEMFEIGNMTAFASSPFIVSTILALTALLLSGFAIRSRPLAFARKPARARLAGTTMATSKAMPARQPLDVTGQMDRLYAIISDCERRASRAAHCHATARAELDQADYHLAALVAADPLLQRISTRVPTVAPVAPRAEASSRPALRLAA